MRTQPDLTKDQIETTRDTYNNCAKDYSERVEWNATISKQVKDRLVLPLHNMLVTSSKVAVLGCGTGRDLKEFISLGHSVHGFDISHGMLKQAKKLVGDIPLTKIDISKQKLPKNEFDAVYSDSVLAYIPNRNMTFALNSIYDSLKPNGVGLLGFKINGYKVVEDTILRAGGLESLRYYLSYPQSLVINYVESAGFVIKDSKLYEDSLSRPTKWLDLFVAKGN